MRQTRWLLYASLPFLALLSACGKKESVLQGTLTYKNKPLADCEIVLLGNDGVPLPPATTDANGNYAVKGVKFGEYFAAILQRPKGFKSDSDVRKEWQEKGVPPPPGTFFDRAAKLGFPRKYTEHGTSGLTVAVSQPVTQFDIRLSEEP